MTTPHPDGETIALDPIPAADNPLVRNARVAADVLFRDPPTAYACTVTSYDVTVQGKTRDGIEGMRYGAFAYLMKPLDLEELIHTLGEAINAEKGTPHA